MSLIERALQKAQDSRRREPSPSIAGTTPIVAPDEGAAAASERPVFQPGGSIALPRQLLLDRGLVPPRTFERRILNQYRRVKRALLATALGRDAPPTPFSRSILVASAIPGEGKTFTSLNLALSLALENDLTVLLVDGDVAKRELTQVLGASNRKGLLELAADVDASTDELILATDEPRLFFMPAGQPRDNTPELLGSARLATAIRDLLAHRPRCVLVFDSPPLLLASEARSLLPVTGQVLMVVKAGETSRRLVTDAIVSIDAERPISLLLNQSYGGDEHGDYYGYPYPAVAPDS
jgi:protein-tyrosine kinase